MVDSCQAGFVCPLVFCFSHSFGHQFIPGGRGTGLIVRRLIILIFADWNRMTCLRHRSCPRSSIVSSAFALFLWIPRGFSQRGRVPPYALDVPPYVGDRTAPSPLLGKEGKASFPSFPRSLYTSTSLAMAHMNPESSRAMAVTTLFFSFPLAISLRNLPQSLT